MHDILININLGLAQIMSIDTLWVMTLGMIVGIIVGALPGLSPAVGCAMMLPLTFYMSPTNALLLLVSVYAGAEYGGSISAICINTPGTAGAVATTFDGYQVTKQGKPGLALGVSLWASAIGGIIGSIGLVIFAIPLAALAVNFESYEYFALGILGLTIISSLSSENYVKGFIAATLGLLLMTIGYDSELSFSRFTFGLSGLQDGLSFIPAIIGLFALSEVFYNISNLKKGKLKEKKLSYALPKLSEIWPLKWVITKASVIGTVIGSIPGAGAAIAAILSYNEAKRTSKHPELFGKGSLEGIAAPEAANNAVVAGAMIPLLSLGIPGSASTAIMLGALMIHKITPGPDLFKPAPYGHPELIYGLFIAFFLTNIILLILGILGNRFWVKLISFPDSVIYSIIISLSFIGSYFVQTSMFDVAICFAFGVIGLLLKKCDFPTSPIVLGLILGAMIEENLRLSLVKGSALVFFTRPMSATLLAIALVSFSWPIINFYLKKRKSSLKAVE